MRVVAITSPKGGCGKTTTAIHLSASLAERGRRVLLVELDPEGHAALGLGVRPDGRRPTVADALLTAYETPVPLRAAAREVAPDFDLAPGDRRLGLLEQNLAHTPGADTRLRAVLRALAREAWDPYDFVLLDAPPSAGLLSSSALRAAGEALIPVEASPLALQGLDRLIDSIAWLGAAGLAPPLRVHVLPTMVDERMRLTHEALDELRARYGRQTLHTRIRASVRFKEAARLGLPITHLAIDDGPRADYRDLADELCSVERLLAGSVDAGGAAGP